MNPRTPVAILLNSSDYSLANKKHNCQTRNDANIDWLNRNKVVEWEAIFTHLN
jgi:hypothetical protein